MPETPKIEAVVFDLGGVLIDWDPRYLYRKVFSNEKEMDNFLSTVATPEWHAEQDRGRTMEDATALLRDRHPHYRAEIEAFYGRWDEMFGGSMEDSVGILRDLKAEGLPLYALTNWPAGAFPLARERWDFLGWFDDIVVSGEERIAKPNREIYDVLVRRTGLDPAKTAFIDDREANVRAADALGFAALEFRDAAGLKRDLQRLGILAGKKEVPDG